MVKSYVEVYLDTTSPQINIYIPSSTTQDSYEDIIVIADESLDIKHDFYIIDSLGVRHDYTLALQNDERSLIGNISFANFPNGIASAYIQAYDKVLNRSSLIVKSFSIGTVKLSPQKLKITVQDQERIIHIFDE